MQMLSEDPHGVPAGGEGKVCGTASASLGVKV